MKKQLSEIFKLIDKCDEKITTMAFNDLSKNKEIESVFVLKEGKPVEKKLELDVNIKKNGFGDYKTIISGSDTKLLIIKDIGGISSRPHGIFIKMKNRILKKISHMFKKEEINYIRR